MVKQLLTISALSLVSVLNAQIKIQSTHVQSSAGKTIVSSSDTILPTQLSVKGANVTWDYSTLTATGQTEKNYNSVTTAGFLSQLYFGAGGSANYKANYFSAASDLPIAELAAQGGFPLDAINMFTQVNTTKQNIVGYEFVLSGQGIATRSDTIETVYSFPLEYNKTWKSRGYTVLDVNPIFNLIVKQRRQRSSEVDGWGTVKTPLGNFQALRIHHTITEQDSIFTDLLDSNGQWIEFPLPTAHEYEWRTIEYKEPVLTIKTAEAPTGGEQVSSVQYVDNYNGLGLKNVGDILVIGPNPIQDVFTIENSGAKLEFNMIDASGKVVYKGQLQHGHNLFEVPQLEKGVYFIQGQNLSSSTTIKVIKN